jgi:hypothetical protein
MRCLEEPPETITFALVVFGAARASWQGSTAKLFWASNNPAFVTATEPFTA